MRKITLALIVLASLTLAPLAQADTPADIPAGCYETPPASCTPDQQLTVTRSQVQGASSVYSASDAQVAPLQKAAYEAQTKEKASQAAAAAAAQSAASSTAAATQAQQNLLRAQTAGCSDVVGTCTQDDLKKANDAQAALTAAQAQATADQQKATAAEAQAATDAQAAQAATAKLSASPDKASNDYSQKAYNDSITNFNQAADAKIQELNKQAAGTQDAQTKIKLEVQKAQLAAEKIKYKLTKEQFLLDKCTRAAGSCDSQTKELSTTQSDFDKANADYVQLLNIYKSPDNVRIGGVGGILYVPGQGHFASGFSLIQTIINTLIRLIGVAALVFLVIGGFKYILAAGNDTAAGKAKDTIKFAIIGLAISLLAYVIVAAVQGLLYGAGA